MSAARVPWRFLPRGAPRGRPSRWGSRPGAASVLWGAALVLAALAAGVRPGPAWGEPALPAYRLDVRLDTAAHTIAGTVTVTLPADDPRLGDVLWFHLPPNRFLEKDPRGPRRIVGSLPFSTHFESDALFDPAWPDGFDPGHIAIQSVQGETGSDLPFTTAPNPTIPQGYSVRDGLLRVDVSGAPGTRVVRIRFATQLPHRYWDGWSRAGVLTDHWYPVLAAWHDGGWDTDVFTPRGGTYEARVTVDAEGQLFMNHGRMWPLYAGDTASFPPDPDGLRALPLVFVPAQRSVLRHGYDLSLYSFFSAGHERMGRLALDVGESFRRYVHRAYGLPPPQTRIAIVEVDLPPQDIVTIGSLVLVPTSFYDNISAMDRILVAQLARAVAQVWFGESVWSNRDTQSWLHLGLAGYLAMDFFQVTYGPDAGVHNLMDWLQPKYREHFFEAPVRELMRSGKDAPLALSLHRFPETRTALLVAYNKAPIVLRSLYFLVGHDAFARALNALYHRHRFQVVTERTLRTEMEAASGMALGPFFDAWFHGTPRVDFAVENWSQTKTAAGYRVEVKVRRKAPSQTPVIVQVTTRGGQVFRRRWKGDAVGATIQFDLPEQAASVAVDPDEYWLELDRKNNLSDLQLRWRPIFDWAKQRDVLIAVRATAGGNATDGNYYGLGVNVSLNENNQVRVMPIYGDRTGLTNYQLTWTHTEFLIPPLSLTVNLEHLSGNTLQSVGLGFTLVDTDEHRLAVTVDLNASRVQATSILQSDGSLRVQPASRANYVSTGLNYRYRPDTGDESNLSLLVFDSRPGYDSAYTFTTVQLGAKQRFALGGSHLLLIGGTRAVTDGTPPVQLRQPLGGPLGLRGYPHSIQLTGEQLAMARLDYGYVVSRRAVGGAAQLRRVTAFVFGDVGRVWDGGETYTARPQRQDAGIGVELLTNLMRLNELPIRADIAFPLHDPEYRDPQFVLFGLLTF